MLVSGHMKAWVATILGTVIGAVKAALTYDRFISETQQPEESDT